MPPARAISVFVDGKEYRIAVRMRPVSSTWLVFIHGWGYSKSSFDGAFSTPALDDFSICALDLVGFGQSASVSGFSYDLADQARIVAKIIRSLKARSVYLFGHSMGGGVGLLIAAGNKNLLTKFISIEGNLVREDSKSLTRRLISYPFVTFRSVAFPMLKTYLRAHRRHDYRQWGKQFALADPRAVYASGKSFLAWSDSGKLLPMFLALPHKAYMYGSMSGREYVVSRLKDVETIPVPGSRHFLMYDNPSVFYARIRDQIR